MPKPFVANFRDAAGGIQDGGETHGANFFTRMAERELEKQEAYALEHGYTIKDLVTSAGWKIFHVFRTVRTGSPSYCHCSIREDAIRIAFALAKTFPETEDGHGD